MASGPMRGADLLRQELAAMKGQVQGWGRAKKLAAFAGGTGRVTRILSRFPRPMWGYTRQKGNWTITQVLWHLADQEAHLYLRLRKAVAEPGGMVSAYDQEKWDRGLLYSKSDPLQARDLLLLLRRANAGLLRRAGAKAWKGRVRHPEWGLMTLDHLVGLNIWHLEHHLAQMGRRFQEWKSR